MITSQVTEKQIAHWRNIYQEKGKNLLPNRISGEELYTYFVGKYKPEEYHSKRFAQVVRKNAVAEGSVCPNIYTFRVGDVFVGIDTVSGFFHVESKKVIQAVSIWDDLFFQRGLNESDLKNFVLVGQYLDMEQPFRF